MEEKVLNIQKNANSDVRKYIKNSFDSLRCALLPYPGKKVDDGRYKDSYNGNWKDMDEDFREELVNLIENLFSPSNLIVKKINGVEITAGKFKNFIKSYVELFQSEKLPEVSTLYDSMMKNQFGLIIDECFEIYRSNIHQNLSQVTRIDEIGSFHETRRNLALEKFSKIRKMGTEKEAEKFRKDLENCIEVHFVEWSEPKKEEIRQVLAEEERKRQARAEQERIRLALQAEEERKRAALEAQRRADERARELADIAQRQAGHEANLFFAERERRMRQVHNVTFRFFFSGRRN